MNDERRKFITRIFHKPGVNAHTESPAKASVILGHLTSFPVGTSAKFHLGCQEFILESLPEGMRLTRTDEEQNIRLSMTGTGHIQAMLSETWPDGAVMSILTGEIYILERENV